LVYVIAAYTITIGTLALYGVMLGYRQRVAVASLAMPHPASAPTSLAASPEDDSTTDRATEDLRKGFNVGAALLAPLWMWAHGMRIPGAVLLVLCLSIAPLFRAEMWLPALAVAAIPLAASAALGFAGNRIAADHLKAEDSATFAATQLPWAIAGIILFTAIAPWVWFFAETR